MKFTCEKYLLSSAIATASRAASSKSPIPALEGLLIEAGNNVRITGYDLKKGIYTSFLADVADPGNIVLDAKLFGDIVRSLPDGIVTVSVEKGELATIKCGASDFSIMGVSADDYPELPDVDKQKTVSIPQNTLRKMIGETIFAVSNNESRPIYTGILFEVGEGYLTMVAVDGYRLAMRKEALDHDDGEKFSFIVPGASLSDLEKICSDTDEDVRMTLGAKHISFTLGDTVLISRRLEGEFINYRKSIADNFAVKALVQRSELARAVDRVSLIIDSKTINPVRCIFGDGEINISCTTSLGKAFDTCSMEGNGNGLEIGFNNKYLLDAVKTAPAEKLMVCLNSGSTPCILKPEDENDSFLYMILPVRLRADR